MRVNDHKFLQLPQEMYKLRNRVVLKPLFVSYDNFKFQTCLCTVALILMSCIFDRYRMLTSNNIIFRSQDLAIDTGNEK